MEAVEAVEAAEVSGLKKLFCRKKIINVTVFYIPFIKIRIFAYKIILTKKL